MIGTRLGHTGPKGTLELDLPIKKKSLFEILNDGLKTAESLYSVTIPWYIMTSPTNEAATKNFFIQNNYFGYSQDHVKFFTQDKLPVVDIQGKVLLREPYMIQESANGNGDIYAALARNNLIQDMKSKNIKWIFICGIDNILLRTVDPLFLGATIASNNEISSKTIFKETALEAECVFGRVNDKPTILKYRDITLKMSEATNENGDFLYREANVLSHILSINALEKSAGLNLPYNRAFKKTTFVNEEGMKQVPGERNSFKFEKFIFDAFSHFDDLFLFRVSKEDEFAPIKDVVGLDTATKRYEKKIARFQGD